MKLVPQSSFDAGLFVEEMGLIHTVDDAISFRDYLVDVGFTETDSIKLYEWVALLDDWAEKTGWEEWYE